ncbi:choice-of-anchor L domain-containing protein [Kaistella sp.]|uniref:choice-of-anchor L domain-containing protein n=1 Tax=Kaistella sp. TaxID=2782235 RepID=UPI003C4F8DD3
MKNLLSLLFGLFFIVGNSQYITVSYKSPDDLVREFIGAQNASCITFSNASVKNWQDYDNLKPFSYGYFEKGTLPFDIEKGIILSTGSAIKAPGPNKTTLSDGSGSLWVGDSDLEYKIPAASPSVNATSLEFDFIANNTTGISFEYMFLSEESYDGNCNYSDAFAFLIKKSGSTADYENIALVPNTLEPVDTKTINGSGKCPKNTNYFGGFNSANGGDDSPTNYNGQTKVLTAKKDDIIPGQMYHIKLVIADHLNYQFDSAVFLKAGSFVGKKDLGPDLLITNNNALCEGETKILDATTAGATSYQWFKENVALSGETNAQLSIPGLPSDNGNYEVEVSLGGCILKGSVKVEIQPKAIINYGSYPLCDEKLTGSVPINFTTVSSQIISNFSPIYVPKYYLKQTDAQDGTGTPLADGWLLSADTDVFVRVESTLGCSPVIGQIKLMIKDKTPLLKSNFTTAPNCDNNRTGSVSVDLNRYLAEFTSDSTITPFFFASLADAKNNTNPISASQTVTTASRTFGIRLQNSTDCANVAEITIIKNTPNESLILKDKPICGDSTTTLDAGSGFDYYKWSTGEEGISKSSISNVEIGDYWVDLSSNGCIYRQFVKVTAAELPQITNIDVTGNTATVFVNGGNSPYQYSLDNITFQGSNIFTNVPRGLRKVYVKDAQNCETIFKEFLVINLINVITPNADGKNDVLDYSDLSIKKDVKIEIFDRYGNQVFISQKTPYIWDGKMNGRVLPTGTYWYILSWTEPDTNLPVSYKGWILLKNRN